MTQPGIEPQSPGPLADTVQVLFYKSQPTLIFVAFQVNLSLKVPYLNFLFFVKLLFSFEQEQGYKMIPNWLIGLVRRVFANCPEDWRSIPGRVIPKT